jgi:hypothetical protein
MASSNVSRQGLHKLEDADRKVEESFGQIISLHETTYTYPPHSEFFIVRCSFFILHLLRACQAERGMDRPLVKDVVPLKRGASAVRTLPIRAST